MSQEIDLEVLKNGIYCQDNIHRNIFGKTY